MRAAIFIDGGYFFKQIQGSKLEDNFQHLADFLLQPLRSKSAIDLMRCYFYYCAPYTSQTPTEDEIRRMTNHLTFVENLEAIPRWQFRSGKLEKRREGDREVYAQKRVDVKLSVDLVRHAAAGHIQHAIIVAGDSDFIPAVKAAQEEGVTVTLCVHNDKSAHRDLIKLVDEVRWIDWNNQDQPGRNRLYTPKKTKAIRTDKSTDSQSDDTQLPEAKSKSATMSRPMKKASTPRPANGDPETAAKSPVHAKNGKKTTKRTSKKKAGTKKVVSTNNEVSSQD